MNASASTLGHNKPPNIILPHRCDLQTADTFGSSSYLIPISSWWLPPLTSDPWAGLHYLTSAAAFSYYLDYILLNLVHSWTIVEPLL
jgi:hypothetical protein